MLNFIIAALILTITYVLLASLMKAAGKSTPLIPNIKHEEDNDN